MPAVPDPHPRTDARPAGEQEAAAQDVAAVVVPHLDDVRGFLALPSSGPRGSVLTWRSSDPDVVTTGGEVRRPATGSAPVRVRLTVTATRGDARAQRELEAMVRPLPAEEPTVAYLFAHFAGESTADEEQVFFAVSQGDTVLAWQTLGGGRPVLRSRLGEQGLRDPFLVRSPEGDRFHLLATDLRVHGDGDFGRAQEHGSTSLMVWDSTDLVHWSDQRMVRVSPDEAGNTWAPEAVWSEEHGQYVVYWASNLYPGTAPEDRRRADSYNRMMYATTRDFVTFSEPQVWIDVRRAPGFGTIDSTVVRSGGVWHRFTKDERPDVMQVFHERSPDLLRPTRGTIGSSWELVAERIGSDEISHGEGPIVFRSNDRRTWYLFQDWPPYGGGRGYVPFQTDDLDSGRWTRTPGATLPSRARHGTVLPITRRELDALLAAFGPGTGDEASSATRAPERGAVGR